MGRLGNQHGLLRARQRRSQTLTKTLHSPGPARFTREEKSMAIDLQYKGTAALADGRRLPSDRGCAGDTAGVTSLGTALTGDTARGHIAGHQSAQGGDTARGHIAGHQLPTVGHSRSTASSTDGHPTRSRSLRAASSTARPCATNPRSSSSSRGTSTVCGWPLAVSLPGHGCHPLSLPQLDGETASARL